MATFPNLVFVFSDRQRFDTMACYGNDWIQTPNLNALAEESVVFRNCYVTQAVCAPARSSIMTGLFPHATGVPRNKLPLRSDVPTIAERLPDQYLCANYGKWHLGDEVLAQHGFDEWRSVMEGLWSEYSSEDLLDIDTTYHEFLLSKGLKPDALRPRGQIFSDEMRGGLPPELQIASYLADESVEFIHRNKDRPFALYVSMLEPHPPFWGAYDDLYDPATLPVDPVFMRRPEGHSMFNRIRSDFFMGEEFEHAPTESVRQQWEERRDQYIFNRAMVGFDTSTEEGWRRLRAGYMSNITLVDDAVGRIVKAIEDAGIADKTILIFTSEHGDLVGTHGMLEMRTFYEAASRVPMMVRAPWMHEGGRMVEGNFSQIDLVPTLMEMMGCETSGGLHGVSRADVISGEADLSDVNIFMEHNGLGDRDLGNQLVNLLNEQPWRSVVTADRWKLNLCANDQGELFDLNSDPWEVHNLYNDTLNADRIRMMAALIRSWQLDVDDTAPLPAT